ncbi:HAD family hydrolase [Kineococcus sp. SYSU DK004]|uniref:HAD family hydrolase n=1 Tax=Kineococcus sp. SYSU DK004 TaxID=3383125 RepID=UPI003D7C5E6E
MAVPPAAGPPTTPRADPATGSGAPSPEPPPAALDAAFFDLDGTLVRGASMFYFARELAARGFFSRAQLRTFTRRALHFALRGEHHGHLLEARQLGLAFVAGREVAEVRGIGEDVYDLHVGAKVRPGTRALAERHLAAGVPVWMVTAAPVELAEPIARRLGLTGALGTVAESVDGVYTGRLVGEPLHGPAKAAAARSLAAQRGWDLSRCAAYSDSANDLPLLRVVGHPAAVNPDAALRRYARDRGWPVHDFRNWRRTARWTAGAGAVAVAVAVTGLLRRR